MRFLHKGSGHVARKQEPIVRLLGKIFDCNSAYECCLVGHRIT